MYTDFNFPEHILIPTDGIAHALHLENAFISDYYKYCETRINGHFCGYHITFYADYGYDCDITFDQLDIAILDAITSIVYDGNNKRFSTDHICCVLSGNPKKQHSVTLNYAVNRSIEKLCHLKISIAKNMLDVGTDVTPILPIVCLAGSFDDCCLYEKNGEFPMYNFANAVGHILKFPVAVHKVPTSDTVTSICLRSYLEREIGIIVQERLKGSSIRFDFLYERLNIKRETCKKNTLFRVRQNVLQILNYYLTLELFTTLGEPVITGYKILRGSKEKYGAILVEHPHLCIKYREQDVVMSRKRDIF